MTDTSRPGQSHPPKGWRLLLYRVCWAIAVGATTAYLPGPVEGKENLPSEGAYILAPVHRSYVDWIVVARVTRRRLRYIVKDAVWKVKWVGSFIELLGAYPVRRGTADREALNRSVEALEGGEPLVLFPEGTRRHGPTLEPILDGAAYLALRAGVPIIPVGVGGSERRMPKGSKFPRPGRISIVIGEPIDPAAWVKEGRSEASGGAARRVPRSATRDLSAVVRWEVQRCFDRAQARLGLATATPEQIREAGIALPGMAGQARPAPAATVVVADAAAAAADDEGN